MIPLFSSASYLRILLCCLFLFPTLSGLTIAADKKPSQKIIPLDWKWKSSEIRDMKKDMENVKTNGDGSFEYEGPTWTVRTFHTPRFTIQVSRYMEMFTEIFNMAFDFQKESNLKDYKPLMTVYPSDAAYQEATSIKGSCGVFMYRYQTQGDKVISADLQLATFYQSNEKEPSFDKEAPLDTIQHEATHCLLQKIFGTVNIPNWLTEGAATYYESWDIRKKISDNDSSPKNVKVRNDRRTHSWRPRSAQYYTKRRSGELPRLDYLTSLNTLKLWNCDNMGETTGYHYCLAESFMDYLMNSKKRRPFLYAMMQRLHDGQLPVITPEEQLEHEKAWLMFLEEKWGVAFDPNRVKLRVDELKKRVEESKEKEKQSVTKEEKTEK